MLNSSMDRFKLGVLTTIKSQSKNNNSVYRPQIKALVYILTKRENIEAEYEKSRYSINSEKFDSSVNYLQNNGYIESRESVTFGGDIRIRYIPTSNGIELVEQKNESIINSAQAVCKEHGNIPVSNLIKNIKESEPAYEWC